LEQYHHRFGQTHGIQSLLEHGGVLPLKKQCDPDAAAHRTGIGARFDDESLLAGYCQVHSQT
jgi:hypothetical protein